MIVTITHGDIGGDEDPNTARLVLMIARLIAPCLDALTGEDRDNAIAVLTIVNRNAVQRGSTAVKSQKVLTASVTYADVEGAFSSDARLALRSLCAGGDTSGAGPQGSFPPAGALANLWPEGRYQ